MGIGIALLLVVAWLLWQAPRTKSQAEEKRDLLDYFRHKDRADREGRRFPE